MNNRIIPTFALVIAAIIFFVYVNPTWTGSIAETKAAIATDNQALAAADTYVKQENQLAIERDAIDPASLDRLDLFLPGSVDNVGLILDLNALAAHSGLSLSNIDVSAGNVTSGTNAAKGGVVSLSASNPVGSIDLSLSAAGSYTALKTFLAGVEKSQRLIDVQDLLIKGSDTGIYNYQLKLRIYWLR